METEEPFVWLPVANVKKALPWQSTPPHFSPGAKIYITLLFGGMAERIGVIGNCSLRKAPNICTRHYSNGRS